MADTQGTRTSAGDEPRDRLQQQQRQSDARQAAQTPQPVLPPRALDNPSIASNAPAALDATECLGHGSGEARLRLLREKPRPDRHMGDGDIWHDHPDVLADSTGVPQPVPSAGQSRMAYIHIAGGFRAVGLRDAAVHLPHAGRRHPMASPTACDEEPAVPDHPRRACHRQFHSGSRCPGGGLCHERLVVGRGGHGSGCCVQRFHGAS
ncbi:hypothetical protein BREU_1536 [Bifidobacterium reuteri DSM 23975]|uniref:Uncharacterized protein n=1 Tax=Bifidobacterium reuteri DSM 23975 TaxID=1437610 RepID=A0A087CSV8_9BIFI|nr:hypothetical protein BREU_1536 [Bifidobacterium reuteri DSM 23975]